MYHQLRIFGIRILIGVLLYALCYKPAFAGVLPSPTSQYTDYLAQSQLMILGISLSIFIPLFLLIITPLLSHFSQMKQIIRLSVLFLAAVLLQIYNGALIFVYQSMIVNAQSGENLTFFNKFSSLYTLFMIFAVMISIPSILYFPCLLFIGNIREKKLSVVLVKSFLLHTVIPLILSIVTMLYFILVPFTGNKWLSY